MEHHKLPEVSPPRELCCVTHPPRRMVSKSGGSFLAWTPTDLFYLDSSGRNILRVNPETGEEVSRKPIENLAANLRIDWHYENNPRSVESKNRIFYTLVATVEGLYNFLVLETETGVGKLVPFGTKPCHISPSGLWFAHQGQEHGTKVIRQRFDPVSGEISFYWVFHTGSIFWQSLEINDDGSARGGAHSSHWVLEPVWNGPVKRGECSQLGPEMSVRWLSDSNVVVQFSKNLAVWSDILDPTKNGTFSLAKTSFLWYADSQTRDVGFAVVPGDVIRSPILFHHPKGSALVWRGATPNERTQPINFAVVRSSFDGLRNRCIAKLVYLASSIEELEFSILPQMPDEETRTIAVGFYDCLLRRTLQTSLIDTREDLLCRFCWHAQDD